MHFYMNSFSFENMHFTSFNLLFLYLIHADTGAKVLIMYLILDCKTLGLVLDIYIFMQGP